MLIDSHCHLDFPDFAPEVDAVVERARAAGVRTMLTIGTRLRAFDGVRAIAERFNDVWCSVGVHPHEAKEEPLDEASALVERTTHPKVVGIGEAGLDYYYEHSPRDDQIRNFRAHIEAARATGLPLIVHTRDADDDMAAILSEEMTKGPFTGLLHCFSSSRELAEKALALGFFISISGIVTFKKSDELRAIVADIPLDRLLVETDSPYLAPMPYRGKRNEPAFVVHTANAVATLKNVDPQQLADATSENFFRLFTKVKRPA
jgi:TatD DNase family protein